MNRKTELFAFSVVMGLLVFTMVMWMYMYNNLRELIIEHSKAEVISEVVAEPVRPELISFRYTDKIVEAVPPEMNGFEATDIVTEEEIKEEVPVEIVEEEKTEYFDVPLSEDLQDHIFAECERYGIKPQIVFAMIERESRYRADVIGDNGNSYGLMQIQPKWHKARMNKLGCTNLLNPYQNVSVGIDLLGELVNRGKGMEWALMAYNGGPSYANKKMAAGTVSNYAKGVLTAADQIGFKG